MIVKFDKSFERALDKIHDISTLSKIEDWIIMLESAKSLKELKSVKRLQGYKTYYRIRIGNYRLGLELVEGSIVRLITVAHRKDIYKRFP